MWPLKTILYFAFFWLACLAALFNPIWGVVNYLLVYQLHPKNAWWGMPLDQLGLRLSLVAVVFTIVGLITGRKWVPSLKPPVSLWEAGIIGLIILGALTLLLGHGYNPNSAYAFEKLWKMMIFVLILGRLVTTRQNLQIVVWTLVAGSLYVGYDAYTAAPSAFWQGRLELIGGSDFATTSGTGAHLAAMLPIIGVAFLTTRRWRWRLFAILSGTMAINTIILCRTRSAFIGLLIGALVALVAAPRPGRIRLRLLVAMGALFAIALTDSYFWSRMETLTDRTALASDEAAVGRTEIWKLSIDLVADHPLGVGPGNFPSVIGNYDSRFYKRSSHNTIVVCVAEFGIQGGILFLLLIAGSLRYLYKSYRLADQTEAPMDTKLLAYGMLIAFVTYVVAGLGTERFYCESFWWILVLPMCLYRIVTREAVESAFVTTGCSAPLENSDESLDGSPDGYDPYYAAARKDCPAVAGSHRLMPYIDAQAAWRAPH